MNEDDVTDAEIRRVAALLGAPVPRSAAQSDPAKTYVEAIRSGISHTFMLVSPTQRKMLKKLEWPEQAERYAEELRAEGMKVIFK